MSGAINSIGTFIGSGGTSDGSSGTPTAPPVPTALQNLQQNQISNANTFAQSLPGMKQQAASGLGQASAVKTAQTVNQNQSNLSARGLGYGGMSAGANASARASGTAGLLNSVSQSNAGFDNASNTMDAQAVETGVGIQQTQQSIQNQLYSQALSAQEANNSITGSAISSGILAGLLFL